MNRLYTRLVRRMLDALTNSVGEEPVAEDDLWFIKWFMIPLIVGMVVVGYVVNGGWE